MSDRVQTKARTRRRRAWVSGRSGRRGECPCLASYRMRAAEGRKKTQLIGSGGGAAARSPCRPRSGRAAGHPAGRSAAGGRPGPATSGETPSRLRRPAPAGPGCRPCSSGTACGRPPTHPGGNGPSPRATLPSGRGREESSGRLVLVLQGLHHAEGGQAAVVAGHAVLVAGGAADIHHAGEVEQQRPEGPRRDRLRRRLRVLAAVRRRGRIAGVRVGRVVVAGGVAGLADEDRQPGALVGQPTQQVGAAEVAAGDLEKVPARRVAVGVRSAS